MTKIAFTALAALSLTGLVAPASAQPAASAEVYAVPISYGDLNLANAAGRATLDNRIRVAGKSICAVNGVVALKTKLNATACQDDFEARAHELLSTQMASLDTARVLRVTARS